jgi:hypothetical protein
MPGQTPSKEEQRLLAKIRAISVLVLVVSASFIGIAVVLLPLLDKDYAVSEGTLVAVFAALTTSAIALAGVARIRNGD